MNSPKSLIISPMQFFAMLQAEYGEPNVMFKLGTFFVYVNKKWVLWENQAIKKTVIVEQANVQS